MVAFEVVNYFFTRFRRIALARLEPFGNYLHACGPVAHLAHAEQKAIEVKCLSIRRERVEHGGGSPEHYEGVAEARADLNRNLCQGEPDSYAQSI